MSDGESNKQADQDGLEVYSNPAYESSTDVTLEQSKEPVTNGTASNGAVTNGDVPSGSKLDDEEHERKLQELRDREPLRFCRWIVTYPKSWFAGTLLCHISCLLLTAILVASGYDILPLVFDSLPLDIRDDVDYLRGLAWDMRYETDTNLISEMEDITNLTQPTQSEVFEVVEFLYLYTNRDQNIFTQANLQAMKDAEDDFYQESSYSDFCFKPVSACQKPQSVLRYFDGTYSHINAVFNDPNFLDITNVIWEAYSNNQTSEAFEYFLGSDFHINSTFVYTSATRSRLFMGYPLAGYMNIEDRFDDQETDIKQYYFDDLMPMGDSYYESGVGDMEFIYSSGTLIGVFITAQVIKDFVLVIGSFTFIVIFMCIQTGSLWISLLAIGSIMTCFTGANLMYRIVYDIRYFGIFHILAVFIILGIGADDVFVFYDTWKQTGHNTYKSLAHRVSDCYRKASLAMMFTSLTTCLAFFISATSPFLAIYSFGAFAGTLVIVNYLSVITFFPCVVVTYHLYWEKYKCCCCCSRGDGAVTDSSNAAQSSPKRKNPIVRFMGGPYYRFVTHKYGRWAILAVFLIIIAVMISYAARLKVNEEQIEFLSEDTVVGRYLKVRSSAYASAADNEAKVYLIWGLKNQDLSDCHHSDSTCFGDTVWDDSFDLNSATAQNSLQGLCNAIRALEQPEINKLRIKQNSITHIPEVSCFIDGVKDFYEGYGMAFPMTQSSVDTLMTDRPDVYTSALPTTFMADRYFEVGLTYWLYNDSAQMSEYADYLGDVETVQTVQTTYNGMDYYYGTELRFAAIVVNTTMDTRDLGYPEGLPIRDDWIAWMTSEMADMPAGLQNGFLATPEATLGFNLWTWLKVQQKLVQTAIVGIAVGILVAWPILTFATHNLIVGALATLTIGIITISVVGVIPAAGWKLGVLESLNLVLVVGLAVDYVVHLAEGYSRSRHHGRLERTQQMLEEVGISVLSGACTTLGASIFLLPAKILFFTQFGVFMFSTIGFSLLYALGLFSTLIAAIGPQGNTGSLKACHDKCCKKDSSGA